MEGVPELTNGLDSCLQGLQVLEETLVMFPGTVRHGFKTPS